MSERNSRAACGLESLALTPDEQQMVAMLVRALRRIRHGSIQIVVQDSRVVQVDTLEKHRFTTESKQRDTSG